MLCQRRDSECVRVHPPDTASRQQEVAEERRQNYPHLAEILPRSHQSLFQTHAREEIRSRRATGKDFLLIGNISLYYKSSLKAKVLN